MFEKVNMNFGFFYKFLVRVHFFVFVGKEREAKEAQNATKRSEPLRWRRTITLLELRLVSYGVRRPSGRMFGDNCLDIPRVAVIAFVRGF